MAVAVGALAFCASFRFLRLPVSIIAAWDSFAFSSIVLAWSRMIFANAKTSVRAAKLQDSSRTAIFLFVIIAALASIFAVAVLLLSERGLSGASLAKHVLLAALTVVFSWILVHTLFALRYAHLYYRLCDNAPEHQDGEGLEFPNEKHPDFLDFAYFSFVIGMTSQVSDVQITSRRIRRLALLHGVISFAFNTVILALSINVVSGRV